MQLLPAHRLNGVNPHWRNQLLFQPFMMQASLQTRAKAVVLATTPRELQQAYPHARSLAEAEACRAADCKQLAPAPQTAAAVLEHSVPRLSLQCPLIDSVLGQGLPAGQIIQISGQAGAGKTQLVLQACLSATLPTERAAASSASAVLIATEGDAALSRLSSLSTAWKTRFPGAWAPGKSPSDQVYVERAATVEALENVVTSRLPIMMQRLGVRLIAIDSIAACYRVDFAAKASAARAASLVRVAAALSSLAARYNAVVLISNQVSSVISADGLSGMPMPTMTDSLHQRISLAGQAAQSESHTRWPDLRAVRPALGMAWDSCVSTALVVSRDARARRWLTVVRSPCMQCGRVAVRIDADGMHGIGDASED